MSADIVTIGEFIAELNNIARIMGDDLLVAVWRDEDAAAMVYGSFDGPEIRVMEGIERGDGFTPLKWVKGSGPYSRPICFIGPPGYLEA